MTDFICPNCRGGFPEPVHDGMDNTSKCPWCAESLDGTYEFEPPTVSHVAETDDSDSDGLLGGFLR